MSLPSVIVSMVIFGVVAAVALQMHTRAATASWDARVRQEAVAVTAWHSALAQQQGCSSYPQTAMSLAGRDVLPHDGYTVQCAAAEVDWPPALTPAHRPDARASSLTVTVRWSTANNSPRSLQQEILGPG